MSFFKYSLLGDFKRRLQLEHNRYAWHKRNRHNDTTPKNLFNINCVEVGNYTYGYLFVMSSGNDAKLKIGSFVSIATDVKFLLRGEHALNTISTFPIQVKVLGEGEDESFAKGDIVVDDDVWIGQNALILSGVHIGQGAVIAAGSVVTKDVEPYAIVAGNPARVIKKRFSNEIINELLKIDFSSMTKEELKKRQYLVDEEIKSKEQLDIWKKGDE
ncbi:Acetyltransferase (isoleucine patch superfamily) [Pseudobutyrivibrio sp. 49]|uniref:CatB-related O-acetyltransferase n=1 Tax=Pseudobutyrivibrio sp. 49 TaxID=1855344 RepID=UPI0008805E0B|nr:Acetyltransferase (isoleucine patch superfamily) [Pseudobutyrivibrio sp. 49]